jgi:outer membrane protein assembly factor BamB
MIYRILQFLLLIMMSTGCSWLGSGSFSNSSESDLSLKFSNIASTANIQRLWETKIGSGASGRFIRLIPVFYDGLIYISSYDGQIVSIDATTGNRVWEVNSKLSISGGVGLSSNGLILLGTDDGEVLALRRVDGGEVWRTTVSGEVLAPPSGDRGIIVVSTSDGKLISLEANSGQHLWTSTYAIPALSLRGNPPPLLVQNMVISGLANGKLAVLSLDKGRTLLEKTIDLPHGRTDIERLIDIDAEQKVFGDMLYAVAYQGSIVAINLHSGNQVWKRPISSYSGIDVDAKMVFISDDTDSISALDRSDGKILWKQNNLIGRRLTAPVSGDGYIAVCDCKGYLHLLNKKDGHIIGRVRAASKAVITSPIVSGDGNTIFVYSRDGTLSAFQVRI